MPIAFGRTPNESGRGKTRAWQLGSANDPVRNGKKLEVAAGLEPAKTGFADQRLDHFGIAT
jgi:hypothetical protein